MSTCSFTLVLSAKLFIYLFIFSIFLYNSQNRQTLKLLLVTHYKTAKELVNFSLSIILIFLILYIIYTMLLWIWNLLQITISYFAMFLFYFEHERCKKTSSYFIYKYKNYSFSKVQILQNFLFLSCICFKML